MEILQWIFVGWKGILKERDIILPRIKLKFGIILGQETILFPLIVPNDIRHSQLSYSIRHLWLIIQGKLPVRSTLHGKITHIDHSCALCGSASETIHHLFLISEFGKIIPHANASNYNISLPSGNCNGHWRQNLFYLNKHRESSIVIMIYACWIIWKVRNIKSFNYAPIHPSSTMNWIIYKIKEYAYCGLHQNAKCTEISHRRWKFPQLGL